MGSLATLNAHEEGLALKVGFGAVGGSRTWRLYLTKNIEEPSARRREMDISRSGPDFSVGDF